MAADTPSFMKLGILLVPEFCTDDNLRLVRQCGAESIVLTCPGFSLQELSAAVSRIRSFGLTVDVIERFVPHDKIVHDLPGRDEQVANIKQLIRNMGALGVKVLCYNWMPSDDVRHTPPRGPTARIGVDDACSRARASGCASRLHSGRARPPTCPSAVVRSRQPLTCVDACTRSPGKHTTRRW